MTRDRLFLLRPGFEDAAYPGRRFFCWHCALIEGLIASFPALADRFDVERIAWPKPRQDVIALVGEENQWLPLLVLADGATSLHQTGSHRGARLHRRQGRHPRRAVRAPRLSRATSVRPSRNEG